MKVSQVRNGFVAALLMLAAAAVQAAPATESGHVDTLDPAAVKLDGPQDLYGPDRIPRHTRKVVFRARGLRRRGDAEGAVNLLRAQLADHPDQDHDMVHYYLGQSLMDLHRYAEARDEFSRAVEMEPRLDRAWTGLGDAAYQLKEYDLAGRAFEKGFRLSPERPVNVLFYAATCALLAEQPARSLELHKELATGRWGDLRLDWYRGLASSALQAGTPAEAETELADMLTRFADDPAAWYLLYQFSVGSKDYRRAAVALTVTGYLRDLTEDENRQLGDLYAVVGVPGLSVGAYRVALGAEPTAEAFEKLVSACLASHRNDQALAILDEALQVTSSSRLWSLKGDVHYLRKEYEEARAAFANVLDQEPANGRANLMVGYCSIELGQPERALDPLGRAAQDPDQAGMAQLLIQRALKDRG